MAANQKKPPPPREFVRFTTMLSFRLEIRCDNHSHGCESVLRLDNLSGHLKECAHNPKRPVACDKGCGMTTIPKDEMRDHNCVRELRSVMRAQDEKISELETAVREAKYQQAENRIEIAILKVRKQNKANEIRI